MREQARISRIIDKIHVLWKRYPDMRFGQLIYNLYRDYMLYTEQYEMRLEVSDMLWALEDDLFEMFLDKKIQMG